MISPVKFYECGKKLFADIPDNITNPPVRVTDETGNVGKFDLAVEISAKSVIAGMLRNNLKNIPTVQINSAEQLKDFLYTL